MTFPNRFISLLAIASLVANTSQYFTAIITSEII